MTDKELLELATKSVVGEFTDPDEKYCSPDWDHDWNPLTDDGDALRLAVKLGLLGAPAHVIDFIEAMGNSDPYAAIRRAIVRAAAEIGKYEMTKLEHWLASCVDLTCSLVAICTLGKYRPNWELDFRCWMMMRRLKK